MNNERIEASLEQAQSTLEGLGCIARMLSDTTGTLPEGPIADSIHTLANVASQQISEGIRLIRAGREVANG